MAESRSTPVGRRTKTNEIRRRDRDAKVCGIINNRRPNSGQTAVLSCRLNTASDCSWLAAARTTDALISLDCFSLLVFRITRRLKKIGLQREKEIERAYTISVTISNSSSTISYLRSTTRLLTPMICVNMAKYVRLFCPSVKVTISCTRTVINHYLFKLVSSCEFITVHTSLQACTIVACS